MDTDILLIQKMRMGDECAVELFVEKYFSRILRYCRSHIGDPGYAEDMAQETFVRFFRTLPQYRHYGKAANYLYAIASNVCSDYYRKNYVRNQKEVRMAFEALPEELREVAVLYFQQEQKQKDIARILGIGLPLVKYRIRKIREWMAEYLEI